MIRIISSALMFLMIAGCGQPDTTRYVAAEVFSKRIHCGEWGRDRYFITTNFGELEVNEREYNRIVPGVPVSVCETVTAEGVVMVRKIARRID